MALITDQSQKFWLSVGATALVAILFTASIFVFISLPPRTVVMATGAEGGASHELGKRYREILAKSGVTLQLKSTTGALENLALLRDPKSGVDVGFEQAGTTTRNESPNVESLGTVSYEPVWYFRRSGIGEGPEALRGKRLSIGPEGSGGRALALEIIKRFKIDGIVGELQGFVPEMAAEKLLTAEIDGAFIVTAWESPVVQRLIRADRIELGSAPRADAYVALYPFLNKLVLPAGVVDILTNRPPTDVVLLAPKASLAVRADLNSAIQHLLLSAAVQIHSPPGIFQKAGQFPAPEAIDLPLSDEAQRFYKNGRPFLQEHLPFWLATLVERVLIVFLPLAVLLYPVFSKLLPSIYAWYMQRKIMLLYGEMRSIESEVDAAGSRQDASAVNVRLDQIDERAKSLGLPGTYASSLYGLRGHIDLVRKRLTKGAP